MQETNPLELIYHPRTDMSSQTGQRKRRPNTAARTAGAQEQYLSKGIGRAFDVLECFRDGRHALTLKELTRLTEMPESSLFRVLLTLEARGYLQQSEDGSYALAPKVLLGKLYEDAEAVKAKAREHLVALSREFDETASLAFLFENRVHVLDSVESFHDIRHTNRIGRVLPPNCSSLGKVVTAFQTPQLIEEILEVYGLFRRTEHTIVDRRLLHEEFARVREAGYAYDRGEATVGGVCIGAPLMLSRGDVVGGVSLSTPGIRITPELEREILRAVVATAKAISSTL